MYNAIILPGLQLICCCPDQLKRIREGLSLSYSLCTCVRACVLSALVVSPPPPRPPTPHTHTSWHQLMNTARGYSYLRVQCAPVVPMVINAGNDCQVFKVTICSPIHNICELREELFFSCDTNPFFFNRN